MKSLQSVLLVLALLGQSSLFRASAAAGESPDRGRALLLQEMARRPADPWPRGMGQVVLGVPGLPEDWKAYHEPGGSFSPAFATFGISIWVVDQKGRLLTTSDTIPLPELDQRLVWTKEKTWPPLPDLPAVETKTPYYTCSWRVISEGKYRLHLRTGSDYRIWILARSCGPSGGKLRSVKLSGDQIFLNDRWTLGMRGPGATTEIADPYAQTEEKPFWAAEQPWGYARIQLMPAQEYWLTVAAVAVPPASSLPPTAGRARISLDLPDQRFVDSLNAQIAHLAMGLVGNETRPGDPNNYPLNWLRDGAYTIVALARAGLLDTARELCSPFAQQDFFGGFGAEADGPGLALWALEEVSVRLNDPSFDDWLWPHVVRKATLIEEMAGATGPVRKPFQGPVVPKHAGKSDLDLVCDAAADGLIQGRMDWHRPLLYVNAVSYRGLVSAYRLADRRGVAGQGQDWLDLAGKLRGSWQKALSGPDSGNSRTAICGLHPAWVVKDRQAYADLLGRHRAESHSTNGLLRDTPLWTYFPVAEAHQWLLLGQPDKAWVDLHWFWDHQASPGLYTWWEGRGEENTFGRWERAMGWVKPPHVTPHYWTAAEMALLQLDMLVAVDETGPQPQLLIGAGLRPEWVAERLRVEGMETRLGRVDWEWRKNRLTVKYRGPEVEIVPGPAFPADLELRVKN